MAWLAIGAAAAYFAAGTPRLLSAAGFQTDTPADRAAAILREHFPERRAPDLYVVFQSRDVPAGDPAYQAELDAWRGDLQRLTAGLDAEIPAPITGRDGQTAALFVDSNLTPDRFIELARQARAIHHAGPAATYLGGLGPVYDAFLTDSETDLRQGELVSLPLAALLLLLVFGGLVAGALPVVTGLACVSVAVALLGAAARLHTVSVFALNISSVVGIGLGIDYSLLVVNRFREEMRGGAAVQAAVSTTVATAGVATAVSGATVLIGFGSLMLTRLNVLWSIGLGGAIVVGVSIVSSLTLIPALLATFGRHLDRLTLPIARGRDTRRFWHGLAAGVMRRPWPVIMLVVAVVAVLASPARALNPGVVGAESLPPGEQAVTAQRLAERELGFARYPPVLVVARGVDGEERAAEVEVRLQQAARGRRVTGPGDVPAFARTNYLRPPYAVFEVDQGAPDNSAATHALLDRLRAVRVGGVTLLIGGEGGAYQDFLNVLSADFPRAFATVLGCTLLLLGIAFRSLALPVKAILMNLLSVGAAMGVLTWGFQEGRLAGLLDFQRVDFVDATIPIVIFAALFGLSMDYEVFLLSRVREEYLRGLDNQAAVAAGMERTGQIITSAALILVVVAGTLAFSHLALNKAVGVTFAVAILLDATLIRLLLVPAFMSVLGDLNWWPDPRRNQTRPPVPRERSRSSSPE
ncbi:MAG TPA: MMPL family transporter [Candidatus Dormibacteraeota bacterium]